MPAESACVRRASIFVCAAAARRAHRPSPIRSSRLASSSGSSRRPRLAVACLLIVHFGAAPVAYAGDDVIRFARRGKAISALTEADLVARLGRARVRVFEPYEERDIVFLAIRFDALLDEVYGPSWREEEELLFTCRDGYQPSIAVARVIRHRAWLAFDRESSRTTDANAGSAPNRFSILKRQSGRRQWIDLSPYYLIWENLDNEEVLRDGDYGWPYQLVGVDLIRFRDRFPKLLPPEGSSQDVRAGMAAFRVHCSRCHAINGQGGKIGQDLNVPLNPTEVRSLDWLQKWIDDPGALRPGTRMPRLNPALPERARTIDEILAYLSAMKDAKLPTPDTQAGSSHEREADEH